MTFDEAVRHLRDGDFSFLEPQFRADADGKIPIVQWHAAGNFVGHPEALAEAFTCACFLGADDVVDYLLAGGASPDGGKLTGMSAFHWAANRGQVRVVEELIRAGANLEDRNRFGGTVLSCTVWSVLNEPRSGQIEVVERLLHAGAKVAELPERTGDSRIDELCAPFRASH